MDERRFDELTKTLVASKPSRREALRLLAGGALATVFGGVALEGASARRVGIELRTCGQRCDPDATSAQCNAGLSCGRDSRKCIAIPSSKDSCSGNGECPEDYETCNNNERCINTVARGCPECLENGDCATDQRCRDGRCRNRG